MDPFTIGGLFLGLAGGVASLFGANKANDLANANLQAETQLLNEAHQQEAQMEEGKVLIGQRNSQEAQLHSPTDKWTASGTLLGNLPAAGKAISPEMPAASQLGI